MTNKNIFTQIYKNNSWGCNESKSGPGSRMSVNKNFLNLLENFVKTHNIKSIIDCGCGDFNWMKLFNFNLIDSYLGIDIVEELININMKKYSTNKINFTCHSIIEDDIPKTDLIICKDVLFHLSYSDANQAIKNIFESKPKYFISTNFTDFTNFDIKSGNWRPINLLSEPFNLNVPYIYWNNIENRSDIHSNKSIGVWKCI